jgi:cell division protein FtsQ
MSSASTIRRGNSGRARPKVSGRRPAAKRKSMMTRLAEALPVPIETIQRVAGYGMIALIVLLAGTAATMMGLPQATGVALAEMTGRAGFEVKRIELTGVDRMERLTVYAIAADQHSMAMPLVDLEKVRRQLMTYGWISDARVSRRLPDTLLIDIVERKPAAIWQNAQKLTLIDATGVELEPVSIGSMPDLPLVVGPDANKQIAALDTLLEAAPALKPMLAGASWIGKRRWDLRFQSGETLALPEGGPEAAAALVKFARMDGTDRLLGRGFVRFDMRIPDKFYVRLPPKGAARPIVPDETTIAKAADDDTKSVKDAGKDSRKDKGNGTTAG